MATNKLNVKLSLRYDTFENWKTVNPVLLPGEVAIATIPADSASGLNEPCVVIKAGDGSTNYNNLQFVSALAADVLTACKTTEGLNTFITDLLKEKGLLSADGSDTQSMTERMTQAETDIDNLQTADEEIRAEIAAKIASTYKASGSVASAEALPEASATTLGNVYNVTADFTSTDKFTEGAGKKVSAGSNVVIVELTPAVVGEDGVETTPATYGYDVVGSFIDLSNYLTKTETTDAIKTAKDEAIAAIPSEVNKALTAPTEEGQPESAVLTTVKGIVDSKIADLDFTDTAVEGEFVTAVTETDGKISTVSRAKVTAEKVDGLTAAVETAVTNALTPSTEPDAPENPVLTKVETLITEKTTELKTEILGDKTTADGTGDTIADVQKLTKDNKDAIDVLNGDATKDGSVDKKVADAKAEVLGNAETADGTGNTIADVKKSIDKLNGDASTEGSVAKQVADAKTELIGDSATADGTGNTIADVKKSITTLNGDATTEGSVDKKIADSVAALDSTISATVGEVVTGITIEDGKLTAVTSTALNINNIAQTDGDELILDCGSAGAVAGGGGAGA